MMIHPNSSDKHISTHVQTFRENTDCNHPYSQLHSTQKVLDAPCYFGSLWISTPHPPPAPAQKEHSWDSGTNREIIPMVEILVSHAFQQPPNKKAPSNTSGAFKKFFLKTHLTSETRRRVYLELLLKFNIQNNKKVALECYVQTSTGTKKGCIHSNFKTKWKKPWGLSPLKKKTITSQSLSECTAE